ncbi:MAG: hypothetical protein II972_05445 [Elusimicrobiaceae bacterium]|nr:hypothetical protein [Elusimicrobiaceae bacterium]MBQ6224536.1 hypothetical protein [Campylobacter sp.]
MEEKTLIEKPTLGPFFWILLISIFLLIAIFVIRQMSFLPVNTNTITELVLDESKPKIDPLKKYFPKPYSVQDLTRGAYDRH